MNVLIIGHDTFENKGCQALVYTTTRLLDDALGGAAFRVFSWDPDYDRPRFTQPGIECEFIRHKFNTNEFTKRNRFWMFLNGTLGLKTGKILYAPRYFYDSMAWADLVVVSGGDILADYGEAAIRHYFFPIAVANAMGKPVYVFAQSISRYRDDATMRFCMGHLNRTALVTVREDLSYEYMKELGLNAPCHRTADPAFTLKPCSAARAREILKSEGVSIDGSPVIGISVSKTATRWGEGSHERFVRSIAGSIDSLAEKYKNARFVFFPHVTYRNDPENDDRVVGREVFGLVKAKNRVGLLEGDYTCEEGKGIIGLCDLFIGARTHATIASSSQLVPTIALAYSTKAFGIMEDVLDRERSVLDVRELTAERLSGMAGALLNERASVIKEMKKRMPGILKASAMNGKLAEGLFKKDGKSAARCM